MYHLAVDIRKTHIATAKSKGAASVIDSQQMQNARLQIVHFGAVLDRFVTPLVG